MESLCKKVSPTLTAKTCVFLESEWTDRISHQILLYQKKGIIEMKKTKWWRSKGATCQGMGSAVNKQRVSLNLYNVSGLFLILFAGLILSIATGIA
jgi:hypothetical protein